MSIPSEVTRALSPLGRVVQYWARDVTEKADNAVAPVEDPNVDNFASLAAGGNVQDSGYDATSFALASHSQAASTITDFKEKALAVLGSATIDGQITDKQTIFTVPTGKTMIVFGVLVRSPSDSLAGLVDLDLGGNAAADDWIQQVTLNAFTATTDYGWIFQPEQAPGPPIVPTKKSGYAAATAFGIKINTGSTDPATFTIALIGVLF